ncbi:methylmalonyl-CoA epimerase [Desulfosporosinus orientis DSM 765]|uniref:Methylmalonyl-CoA epimerase n=1 Tax=Desulfosporosinus orientis (strain ATCC 19365 / DSM 765 / NCIMB 8382 / VKM B-1628 / Singapore I) TaxID=768706 RepID=G7WIA8_DESOD|nr:methylmalonyl-CoA epimerase [Desulfosporosinus orientis]AET68556.1 methylmalonyl-CoA epimerase [Desulfosporosinus orientis DSM 765]
MDLQLKLDHLGIAVKNLDEAISVYLGLGLSCSQLETIPEQKVRTATLRIGDTNLELLEPMEANSPVGKFLAARGGGIHHLAFQVESIEEKLFELKNSGIRLIDKTPRIGLGGSKVAFIHPQSTFNTLIELVERCSQV